MSVKFQIESISSITDRGKFVFAKYLDGEKDFYVPQYSTLGGIEITTHFDMPGASDSNKNRSTDLWKFQLKHPEDSHKLKADDVVELFPGNSIAFLPPWEGVTNNDRLENELQKELSQHHILYGKEVKAIARRRDTDDVIFEIAAGKYALVHLSWQGQPANTAEYPQTKLFDHWTKVYGKVIAEDNRHWKI